MTTPLPRDFLLFSRLLVAVIVSLLQVYALLTIALAVLPALAITGMMHGALVMLLASTIRQLENFAGLMNFVIFPMFFGSSALYPLWKIQESSIILFRICSWNPFTYAVELIRFALYGQLNMDALLMVCGALALFLGAAVWACHPALGVRARRSGR